MDLKLEEKINIGISACQIGAKVRYNVKGYDMLGYLDREKSDYVWHPVCPEVMAGLGVPRYPIRIIGGNGFDVLNGIAEIKNRRGKRLTKELLSGSKACLETLKAGNVEVFIYMEGSPSCGVYRTTLKNKRLGHPPGLFGAMLLNEEIFLIPSSDLQSPVKWWDSRRRLQAFVWLKRQDIKEAKDIYEAWHFLKFLCQELDNEWARDFGRKIGDLTNYDLQEIKKEILFCLRKPSSLERIMGSLKKNYSFLRKKFDLSLDADFDDVRGMKRIAEKMLLLERLLKKEEYLFGTAPIDYKPPR